MGGMDSGQRLSALRAARAALVCLSHGVAALGRPTSDDHQSPTPPKQQKMGPARGPITFCLVVMGGIETLRQYLEISSQ